MGPRGLVLAIACALAASSGCYSPAVDSCLYACNQGACPNGLSCNGQQMCAETATTACTALPTDAADPAAPVVSFRPPSPQPSDVTGPHVTFAWTVVPAAPQVCELDGVSLGTCTSPVTYQVSHGAHKFVVRASDNVHVGSARVDWLVNCSFMGGPGGMVLMHWNELTGDTLQNELGSPNGYLGSSPSNATDDPTRIVNGRLGPGLDFGSAPSIAYATWSLPTTRTLSAFTLETWINPGTTNSQLDVFSTLDTLVRLEIDDTGSVPRIISDLLLSDLSTYSRESAPISRNTWHHVVVTFASTTHCLYVDGAMTGCKTGGVANFTFTTLHWGSPIKTAGRMDEVFFGDQAWPDTFVADRFCPL